MVKLHQRAVYLDLPKNPHLDIEFDGLTYTVPNGRKGKKEILHDVSGTFRSGEITAIMGPSGAGKSSLLNILSGFEKSGISGKIRCMGRTGDGDEPHADKDIKYKKECCYILQDDTLCPLFTVQETMDMAAKLKLGESLSEKAKNLLISDILMTLGLSNTIHTRCGRLSGGQKKRLSVALELIDNPPIMFLDEPTTGLDSSSSLQCITILKNLARGGRTIVCTIHQPSAMIFEMFDHVYVLAAGNCVYQGSSDNTVPFLASVGLQCPQYHNPADHLIEVANGDFGDFNEHLTKVTKETNWRITENTNKMLVDNQMYEDTYNNDKTMVLVKPPTELYKFRILFVRHLLQLYRDWTLMHLRVALHIMVGIFVGILYYNYGNDGSKSIKNLGYCIITMVYLLYTSLIPAVVNLPAEVPIFKKECFNNWYQLSTFYFSYILVNIPIQIFFSLIHTLSSYFITGQIMELSRMWRFLLIISLTTVNAESMGFIFGTLVDPIKTSHIRVAANIVVSLIFGLVYQGFGSHAGYTISNSTFMLVIITYMHYTIMMPAVLKFPMEMPIIKKEHFNNWYKLGTYYTSSLIANLPLQIVNGFTTITIGYVMSGQPKELYRYLLFLNIAINSVLVSDALGILVGTLFDVVNGIFMGAVYTAILILMGGILVLYSNMSIAARLIAYTSFFGYTVEGFMLAVYGYDRPSLPCPDQFDYCYLSSPDDILDRFSMNNSYWADSGALLFIYLILKIAGYWALSVKVASHNK